MVRFARTRDHPILFITINTGIVKPVRHYEVLSLHSVANVHNMKQGKLPTNIVQLVIPILMGFSDVFPILVWDT